MKTFQWEDERQDLNREKFKKGLSKSLQNKLSKVYKPHERYDDVFKGNDITFFTNEHGEPVKWWNIFMTRLIQQVLSATM